MKKYRVLKGINYTTVHGEVRREPGDLVDDIPEKSVTTLKFKRAIVEAEGAITPTKPAPKRKKKAETAKDDA